MPTGSCPAPPSSNRPSGLLQGKRATTYPTAQGLLAEFDVEIVEEAFVCEGTIATAAGCLAGVDLAGWIIAELAGSELRDDVLRSVQPVGRGLRFADAARVAALYAGHPGETRAAG